MTLRPSLFLLLTLAAGALLAPATAAPVQPVRLFQEQVRVYAVGDGEDVFMPMENIVDISRFTSVVYRITVHDSQGLHASTDSRIKLQTSMSAADDDFVDVGSALNVDGSDNPPIYDTWTIDVDDTEPIARYLRWVVTFNAYTGNAYLTFSIDVIGHP